MNLVQFSFVLFHSNVSKLYDVRSLTEATPILFIRPLLLS